MPVNQDVDLQYVLYGRPSSQKMGAAGPTLLKDIGNFGIEPPVRAFDLLSLALAVGAADDGCLRKGSSDGWTRRIDLEIAVRDVDFWQSQTGQVEQLLRFLSGDIWNLQFAKGGISAPPVKKEKKRNSIESCACLLSGGADSLTGAIDIVAEGQQPLFVSQVANGDKDHQQLFATQIVGLGHHLQLNHNIDSPGVSERSQRARSLLFIAYGVIGATCLDRYQDGENVELNIPENGFISLNIPLTPLRLGSLSTRTTHPFYLNRFQDILDAAGLRVRLKNRFCFKTKGELISECRNQDLLKPLICHSTSCGRFARMGFVHCGRCVPCIIRRAAFQAARISDTTKYRYANLSLKDEDHRHFDDVRSACFAVQQVRTQGLESWIGGALSTTQVGDLTGYKELLGRGIEEIAAFLEQVGAL